jgi:hypothetical protein
MHKRCLAADFLYRQEKKNTGIVTASKRPANAFFVVMVNVWWFEIDSRGKYIFPYSRFKQDYAEFVNIFTRVKFSYEYPQ